MSEALKISFAHSSSYIFVLQSEAYSVLAHSIQSPSNTLINTSGNPAIKVDSPHVPLISLPDANRKNYPLVKYWYRHEWTVAENSQVAMIGAPGKARASHGENVTMWFVERQWDHY